MVNLIFTATAQVEVMTAEDSDDDMEDMAEEGIPMQGEDGQHYVVLEV